MTAGVQVNNTQALNNPPVYTHTVKTATAGLTAKSPKGEAYLKERGFDRPDFDKVVHRANANNARKPPAISSMPLSFIKWDGDVALDGHFTTGEAPISPRSILDQHWEDVDGEENGIKHKAYDEFLKAVGESPDSSGAGCREPVMKMFISALKNRTILFPSLIPYKRYENGSVISYKSDYVSVPLYVPLPSKYLERSVPNKDTFSATRADVLEHSQEPAEKSYTPWWMSSDPGMKASSSPITSSPISFEEIRRYADMKIDEFQVETDKEIIEDVTDLPVEEVLVTEQGIYDEEALEIAATHAEIDSSLAAAGTSKTVTSALDGQEYNIGQIAIEVRSAALGSANSECKQFKQSPAPGEFTKEMALEVLKSHPTLSKHKDYVKKEVLAHLGDPTKSPNYSSGQLNSIRETILDDVKQNTPCSSDSVKPTSGQTPSSKAESLGPLSTAQIAAANTVANDQKIADADSINGDLSNNIASNDTVAKEKLAKVEQLSSENAELDAKNKESLVSGASLPPDDIDPVTLKPTVAGIESPTLDAASDNLSVGDLPLKAPIGDLAVLPNAPTSLNNIKESYADDPRYDLTVESADDWADRSFVANSSTRLFNEDFSTTDATNAGISSAQSGPTYKSDGSPNFRDYSENTSKVLNNKKLSSGLSSSEKEVIVGEKAEVDAHNKVIRSKVILDEDAAKKAATLASSSKPSISLKSSDRIAIDRLSS